MKTLIIYASLYVIFQVGIGCIKDDTPLPMTIQIFGALNALFAIITAYIYALYNLYQIWMG